MQTAPKALPPAPEPVKGSGFEGLGSKVWGLEFRELFKPNEGFGSRG